MVDSCSWFAKVGVSIRRADLTAFEHRCTVLGSRVRSCFNPPSGSDSLRTEGNCDEEVIIIFVSIRRADLTAFEPTGVSRLAQPDHVSIRRADLTAFERLRKRRSGWRMICFNPPSGSDSLRTLPRPPAAARCCRFNPPSGSDSLRTQQPLSAGGY